MVGVANTLFSAVVMFLLYNLAHFNYWGSSSIAYVLGSILSFFLNKNFTFQNKESLWKTGVKFALNVAVCYVLAYSLAKPAVLWALAGMNLPQNIVEQAAMLFGMVLFTIINYIGQRFFAFQEKNKD
jgi:putative flippase GtrA